jgi:DNA mismatch repair protein MutL
MPIQILPDEIASQIAAGEVVERPASVVKELLENALDAGASHITVQIEGAGKTLIEVADDGMGISSDELSLAIGRHATSKLSSAEDLFRIETLGFRGEALASISSISRFMISSRSRDEEIGSRLIVEGGNPGEIQTFGSPIGTVVRVQDLFYNVPARLKFLKTDRTERRHIDLLVTRYALAYPKVRFNLRMENRTAIQTTGNGDRREVLAAMYGVDIAKQMIEVLAEYDDIGVTGYISSPGVTRSNRAGIGFYVNGRPIQDASLTTAVVQSYHTMLMVGRYPLAVLFLEMHPEVVDVNVHPTKAEVRFENRNQVFRSVGSSVRKALLAHTPVPGVEAGGTPLRWTWTGDAVAKSSQVDPAWGMSSFPESETKSAQGLGVSSTQQDSLPDVEVPLLRLVGQVATAYLVAEGPDGLYLIDQHAAHERILFEKFMRQRSENIPSQVLLEPIAVELPSARARLLEGQLDIIGKLGFVVEPFGRETFLIRSIPVILTGMDPTAALRVLVEDFEEDETPLESEIEAKIIARVCKRAAVKAGQVLSMEEQTALLHDLEACQAPRTCPHGRPTMIHLSVDLLERQFGRRGAR